MPNQAVRAAAGAPDCAFQTWPDLWGTFTDRLWFLERVLIINIASSKSMLTPGLQKVNSYMLKSLCWVKPPFPWSHKQRFSSPWLLGGILKTESLSGSCDKLLGTEWCSPKFRCWSPNPTVPVFGDGTFGREAAETRPRRWGPHDGVSALVSRDIRELSINVSARRRQSCLFELGRRTAPEPPMLVP